MDEIQINGEEGVVGLGDDFYEKIEAPKFVDLTAPDHFRPSDDDRYWFCLRVGCDQKHEQEMDSEEIYKNFLLRVMAARSPNVRFRKALCRKDPSTNVKCPLTVPAKSSKSRIARLALVSSSISQKMFDGKVKARPPLSKHSTTLNEKSKQSSVVAKCMTTPRNKKRLSNPGGTFRSVRNPKPTSIAVPKNRVVAKALVFHSPKKTVKIKTSAELSTRMKAICEGMKKLEITGGKKQESGHNKPLPLDAPRKQFRGREVRSRVYDSLRSKNCQSKAAKSSKCLNKRIKEKDVQQAGIEGNENDSSDVEIEEKSKNGLLEVCTTSGSSKSNERNEQDEECLVSIKNSETPSSENKGEVMSDTTRNNMTSLSNCEEKNPREDDLSGENNKTNEGTDSEEKDKSNSEKIKVMNGDGDGKENATSSNDIENESKAAMSNDDKENNSSADDNRKLNLNSSQVEKKKIPGKHETCKSVQMVSKGICKTSKGNSVSGATCAEGVVNYRKPKLTNPKPFRLRTDERQIVKEANLEKKLHPHEPLKEITTIARVQGGSSQRKLKKAVHRNETCLEQVEYASDAHDGSERKSDKTKQKDEPIRMKTSCSQTSKGALGRKQSTTQQRCAVSMRQKTNLAAASSQQELGHDRTAKRSEKTFKRTKSLCVKQSTVSQGTESSKKKRVSLMTPGRLGVIKESSPTILTSKAVVTVQLENGSFPLFKRSASAAAPGSSSASRRRLTVPKEPHFHDVHRPKSCTRRK